MCASPSHVPIAVAVPVHNGVAHLPRALECLLSQTWSEFGILVLDDGSTGGSGEVIRQCALRDRRIRHGRLDTRAGLIADWLETL